MGRQLKELLLSNRGSISITDLPHVRGVSISSLGDRTHVIVPTLNYVSKVIEDLRARILGDRGLIREAILSKVSFKVSASMRQRSFILITDLAGFERAIFCTVRPLSIVGRKDGVIITSLHQSDGIIETRPMRYLGIVTISVLEDFVVVTTAKVSDSSLVVITHLVYVKNVSSNPTLRLEIRIVGKSNLPDIRSMVCLSKVTLGQIKSILVSILKCCGLHLTIATVLLNGSVIVVAELVKRGIAVLSKRHARRKDECEGKCGRDPEKLSHGFERGCVRENETA